MKLKFVLLIAALAIGTQVKAQMFKTTADLKATCSTYPEHKESTYTPLDAICVSYVGGWADGVGGSLLRYKGKLYAVQFAPNVTASQMVKVFVKYVCDHPEVENKEAITGLVFSLLDAKLMEFVPVAEGSTTQ